MTARTTDVGALINGGSGGATLDVAAGLAPEDRVIETPPDGIVAGTEVRVAGPTAAP